MKFFFRSKNADKSAASTKTSKLENSSVDGTVGLSSSSHDGSRNDNGNKKRSRKKAKGKQDMPSTNITGTPPSKYIQAGHNWMYAMNNYIEGDPQAFMDRITACFEAPDSPLILEDGEEHKAEQCSALFHLTHASFPDFCMKYGKVTEQFSKDEIIVEIHAVYATGTHTGEPYTIMPGLLPAIPPSGKYTEDDEQMIVLHMNKDAKITKCQVVALGTATGFAGFYTAAGGDVSSLLTDETSSSL